MHWDFVFTCFEPLTTVTGGIGTYMRLLLTQLGQSSQKPNILFIPKDFIDPELVIAFSIEANINVEIQYPSELSRYADLQNLGDDHAKYSYAVSEHLIALQQRGDTFGLIEVADYGREGFFIVKRRRFGELRCGAIAVRLHSPELMLFEDNRRPLCRLDSRWTEIFEEEVYCFRHADLVLFGGDAMLERVQALVEPYGVDLRARAIKISHPFPDRRKDSAGLGARVESDGATIALRHLFDDKLSTKIVYSGRLERRKGVLELVKTALEDQRLKDAIISANVHFVFCGQDTETSASGGSLLAEIEGLLDGSILKNRFTFVGYLQQSVLSQICIPAADGFLFPSLFENFPNAFIETLDQSKPTLVSSRGCMPEIGENFPHVFAYDPLSRNAAGDIVAFLAEVKARRRYPDGETFADHAAASNARMVAAYLALGDRYRQPPAPEPEPRALTVSFIVPNFKCVDYLPECLRSVRRCMGPDDELIVIDDCSGEDEAERVAALVEAAGGRFIGLDRNSGPSAARNAGARVASCDLIQFIDADDLLDDKGVALCRRGLGRHDDIDMVYGFSQTFGRSKHIWAARDSSSNVFDRNFAPHCVMIRRAVFEEAGGYNEDMRFHYEDWQFNAKMALLGKNGEMVPRITTYYRNRAGSRTFSNLEREQVSRETMVQYALQDALSRKGAMVGLGGAFMIKAGAYLLNWQRAASWIAKLESAGSAPPPEAFDARIAALQVRIDELRERNDELRAHCDKLEAEYRLVDRHNFLEKAVRRLHDRLVGLSDSDRMALFRQSKLFDPSLYLERYPDLVRAGFSRNECYAHFDRTGWREGRWANARLNAAWLSEILACHLDQGLKVNPLLIYEALQLDEAGEVAPEAPPPEAGTVVTDAASASANGHASALADEPLAIQFSTADVVRANGAHQ